MGVRLAADEKAIALIEGESTRLWRATLLGESEGK
jgi:hypothetical protein